MPVLSEMRREAMLAIAFGARRTGEAEDVKPVDIYDDHRFRHKALSVAGKSEPVSAVVPFIARKTPHRCAVLALPSIEESSAILLHVRSLVGSRFDRH